MLSTRKDLASKSIDKVCNEIVLGYLFGVCSVLQIDTKWQNKDKVAEHTDKVRREIAKVDWNSVCLVSISAAKKKNIDQTLLKVAIIEAYYLNEHTYLTRRI